MPLQPSRHPIPITWQRTAYATPANGFAFVTQRRLICIVLTCFSLNFLLMGNTPKNRQPQIGDATLIFGGGDVNGCSGFLRFLKQPDMLWDLRRSRRT